jgi:hypothetical protein
MVRYLIFTFIIFSSINVEAFQWNDYDSEIQLALEINNGQMRRKASDVETAKADLLELIEGLSSSAIISNSESSRNFLLGLANLGVLKINRLTTWANVGTKGSKIWLNSKEFKTQNAIITKHYVKGLNSAIEIGESIDPQWLYIITASTILDTQVREAVTRYEMHQNQNNPPTETYFWDSYSSIYEAYLNEKDYDNAQRILSEMTSKFPEKKNKVQKAQKQVEKYIEENAEEIKSEAAKTEIPVKKSVQAALEKVAVLTVDDVFEDPVEVDKAVAVYAPKLIQFKSVLEQYGIFILAFLVFLGMYFFSNRKSKK